MAYIEGRIVNASLITPMLPTEESNIIYIILLSIIIIIIICLIIYWVIPAILYCYPSILKKILFENFRMPEFINIFVVFVHYFL